MSLRHVFSENKDKAAGKKKKTKGKQRKQAAKKSASTEDMSKVFKVIEEDDRSESPDSHAAGSNVENDDTMSEVSDGVKSEVSR